MKRSPQLTPLSRDHHKALFAAQRLKRAEDGAEAREAFVAFWEGHGRAHFRIEEDILLPGWFEATPEGDRAMAARVVAEHLEIRTAARRIAGGRFGIEQLRELGALLEAHVRFEERELFPLIEEGMEAGALERLGDEIAAAEQAAER